MSLVGARLAALAALAALAMGCASEVAPDEDASSDATEEALVHGTPARAGQFPATIFFGGTCTGVRVAPKKVLTAAHCVYDAFSRAVYLKAGQALSYQRDVKVAAKSAPIKAVHVHPSWLEQCGKTPCTDNGATARIDTTDVAMIELETDLEGVAAARVDTVPLAHGDRVVVLGYGCEEGAQVEQPIETRQLKFAETPIVLPSRAVHEGSPITREDVARVGATYAMTGGPGLVKARAGLCPGDSGGPVYRWRGSQLVVVGVNSNFTFRGEDTVGLSVTNWHSRLDASSRHRVEAWLRERGALGE